MGKEEGRVDEEVEAFVKLIHAINPNDSDEKVIEAMQNARKLLHQQRPGEAHK